jgi:hypothetical protein
MRARSIHSCLRNPNRRSAQSLLAALKRAAASIAARILAHSPSPLFLHA